MLKKTIKTPVEAVGTACLDGCECVSSGEQAPRPSPLTSIISAKSPLRLAKNIKKGLTPALSKGRGRPFLFSRQHAEHATSFSLPLSFPAIALKAA